MTLLISNFSVAYSVNIDGIHSGDEWDGATVNKIFDGESNSGADFGLVQTMIDDENSAVFLCFMHKDPNLEVGNLYAGVEVSIESSNSFEVISGSSPSYADSSEYSFEGAVSVDENNGATTEIRVGFKFGLPREISCKVRFIDASGAKSNQYGFKIINDFYTETTEMTITQTQPETTQKETTQKITTSKKDKTTKPKKETTKKAEKKTTKKSQPKTTKKTTVKQTTVDYFNKKYTYVKRTRPHTTKKQTAKQTEPVATQKKTKAGTVYYYEKEIIVSQVYVSLTEPIALQKPETVLEVSDTEISEVATLDEPKTEIKSSFSLSEGTKKKTIIGVLAAISFTVIAAVGTRSSKKSIKNNDGDNAE